MSIEAALQRMSELRSRLDAGNTTSGGPAAAADNAWAFAAALEQAKTQGEGGTGAGTATTGGPPGTTAAPSQLAALMGGGGAGLDPLAASADGMAMTEGGLPILSVADQYRLLGIEPPVAPDPSGSMGAPGGLLGTASATSTRPGSGGVGARMVALARRELGVSETSTNDSSRIREFRTATEGAESSPGPWCAYFVSWLAKQAGAPIGAGGNGTGYVPTLEAWGRQQDRFTAQGEGRPRPGDIVIFDWQGGGGTADHTGIVEHVDADGTVHTIEGNSSDRVQRREYSGSTNVITGYVRPG